jgi:hypothetical protein
MQRPPGVRTGLTVRVFTLQGLQRPLPAEQIVGFYGRRPGRKARQHTVRSRVRCNVSYKKL